ncbi:MAG: hypothetical protein ABIO38_07155 [Luteimonas sp.]
MKRLSAVVGLLLASGLALAENPPPLPMPSSGSLTRGNWTFDYSLGDANEEGLVIKNLRWKGTKVLHRASLPVIRVKYRGDGDSLGDGCGPWRDQIDWDAVSFVQGQVTPIIGRVFSDGTFELAVFAEIGGYDLYQAYYFSNGRFEPKLYSSGWSCGEDGNELDHKHHPYWRLDFDVEGPSNEVWRIKTKTNGNVQFFKYPREWNSWKESDDQKIEWTINKPGSSKHVRIRYPANGKRDGAGSAWFNFSSKDMGVRAYHGSEDNGWNFDWNEHLGYRDLIDEPFASGGSDSVFWAVGHLYHEWTQSDENNPHWHDTGLIIEPSW